MSLISVFSVRGRVTLRIISTTQAIFQQTKFKKRNKTLKTSGVLCKEISRPSFI